MTPTEAHARACQLIVGRQLPGFKGREALYLLVFGPPALTRHDDGGYSPTGTFLLNAVAHLTTEAPQP